MILLKKQIQSRKKRILNAAFREFAEKGYEDASTNRIVKNAEIGKGTLFYHFGNKENLYIYWSIEGYRVDLAKHLKEIDFT